MFVNISFGIYVAICILAMFISLALYFVIYKNYIKRNELKLGENLSKCFEFVSKTIVAVFFFVVGIDYLIEGMLLIEAVYERYTNLGVSILVISLDIFFYLRFIKGSFVDIDRNKEKIIEENTNKLSEYVFFFMLCTVIITPILNLPNIVSLFYDTEEFVFEIIKSFTYTIIGCFLMYVMNPLEVLYKEEDRKKLLEEKLKKDKEKEKLKEKDKKKEEVKEEIKEEKKETKKDNKTNKTTKNSSKAKKTKKSEKVEKTEKSDDKKEVKENKKTKSKNKK